MHRTSSVILCLAYLLGVSLARVPGIAYVWLLAAGVLALGMPRLWRKGPRGGVWFMAGVVGFFATVYLQGVIPQPAADDVARYANQEVTLQGRVVTQPTLNRNQRLRFVLAADRLLETELDSHLAEISLPETVSGQLYVTVLPEIAEGLHPGQEVRLTGWLYEPQAPRNPTGFDFREFLARQGIFAGLRADIVEIDPAMETSDWGWWRLRDRIVRTHEQGLGVPQGPLVSAMVLGGRAVSLPHEIRDRFIDVGLAHALAASGFHVSLILGAVLGISRRWGDRPKLLLGLLTLLVYVGLVGFGPSVLRAALMGGASLLGLALERRVNPLGALLLAAVVLLLLNPLWIEELGFQLSFLATLGLLVTVPALVKHLDWCPPRLSPMLAVPLAAMIWTLPLQLGVFGQMPTYSILANVLATPFLVVVTLGGFVSAIAALIVPELGAILAWSLAYPVRGLLGLVSWIGQLPQGAIVVQPLQLWQVLGLYGLMAGVWGLHHFRPRYRIGLYGVATMLGLLLLLLPGTLAKANLLRVTVLATRGEPAIALQQGWQTSLISGGDPQITRYAVLPFLQQEGVGRLQAAIATSSVGEGWDLLLDRVTPREIYRLSEVGVVGADGGTFLAPGMELTQEGMRIQSQSNRPPILCVQAGDRTWLILGNLSEDQQQMLLQRDRLCSADYLVFFGRELDLELLTQVRPTVLIIPSPLSTSQQAQMTQLGIQILNLTEVGAVQWTPQRGLEGLLQTTPSRRDFS
ncbi:MAG: ComEC/Rec2 family competence protein [Phormidium sp. GEM2.Bin31]|nr:MAG: ComEC/Rec2 family competence protein [Phormidium sp. GEM2.Bin31]